MFKGKIFEAESYQYRCRSNITHAVGSSGMFCVPFNHYCEAETFYNPDFVNILSGIFMRVQSGKWAVLGASHPSEDPNTTSRLVIDALGVDLTETEAVYRTDADSVLELRGLKLYEDSTGVWQLKIEEWEWFCAGVSKWTHGAAEFWSEIPCTPMSTPLIPGAVRFKAGCDAQLSDPTGVLFSSMTNRGEIRAVAHVGFRFKQNGVWYSPKVAWPTIFNGGQGTSLSGIVSATNMWNGTITTEYFNRWDLYVSPDIPGASSYTCYGLDSERRLVSAEGVLFPNYQKAVERMNDDYGALIRRSAFPACVAQSYYFDATRTMTLPGGITVPYNVTERKTILPALSIDLDWVELEPSHVEEPFQYDTLSHLKVSYSEANTMNDYEYVVPDGTTEANWIGYTPPSFATAYYNPRKIKDTGTQFEFPWSVNVLSSPASQQVAPYLTHLNHKLITYFNTWGAPHWSFRLEFPPEKDPETGESIAGDAAWKIEDIEVTPREYWLTERSQYAFHPSLPVGRNKRIRNTIVTEPLRQGGNAGFAISVWGQITSWWGISRFHLQRFEPLGSYWSTEETAPAWSFEDPATGFVDVDGIHFDPGTETSVVVELDVGRWDSPPYMAPHGCNRIWVRWTDGNIASVTVKCIGSDGAETILATEPGLYQRPRAPGTHYAGTWGHDYSGNLVSEELTIVDQGLDLLPQGRSVPYMDNRERAFCFGLLPGSGCAKLRFEVERVDPDEPTMLEHPTFLPPSSDMRRIIYESAPYASIICEQGPVIRYGMWTYWDPIYGFVHEPPNANGPELMPTALDWLCWYKQVIRGEAADHDLDAEIAEIYELGEEYTLRKHLAMDADDQVLTHSFIYDLDRGRPDGDHKLAGIMVQSFREMPPHPGFPAKAWDLQEGTQTSEYALITYSLIATRRWLVNPGAENNLIPYDPPGDGDWLTQDYLVYRWFGGWHMHSLDGMEGREWKVRRGETDYAKVRPWRGYVWIADTIPEAGPVGGWHARTSYTSGLTYAVKVSSEGLDLWRYNRRGDVFRLRINEDDDLVEAQLVVHPRGLVSIFYTKPSGGGHDVLRIDSNSHGRTWSGAVVAFPGKMVAPATDDRTAVEYAAAWEDGDWKLWRKSARSSPWEDRGVIVADAPENRAGLTVTGGPRRELAFHYFDGTDDRRLVSSDDGEHWMEA